jgi:hypothetical protein
MYCPHCGAWNPEESKFCGKCGQPLRTMPTSRRERWIPSGLGVAGISLLVLVTIAVIGAFMMRDRLGRAWQSFIAQPTQTQVPVIPTPTMTPTQVPIQPTATLTALPIPSPTSTELPTPVVSPTTTQTPTPIQPTFKLIYKECNRPGLALGSVKGRVFNKEGGVIPGAKVRITIDGYEWESDANPARTNAEGWYEWILEVGQKVQFVELIVDGKSVPFSPLGFEVEAIGGCFQRVDFIEQ